MTLPRFHIDQHERSSPFTPLDEDGVPTRVPEAPAGLFLSRRGAWYHDGDRVRHAGLEGLLHRSIARNPGGALIVTTGRDVLPFFAEDAPFFVRTLTSAADDLEIALSDGSKEPLSLRALFIDDTGRVRCAVRNNSFWALWSRSATQLLMARIDDEGALPTPRGRIALRARTGEAWSAVPALSSDDPPSR